MTNLERNIMFSRGYVNFATWANKPNDPPPPGYEYRPYLTQFGNKRWRLVKLKHGLELMKEAGPEAAKALFKSGVEPGTTGNMLSEVATQALDAVSEDN